MAEARQRAEWERTSWVMAWVGRLTGGPFEPHVLNPMADPGRPAATRAAPGQEAAKAWGMLAAGLRQVARKRGAGGGKATPSATRPAPPPSAR